ncbi:hypothetical protein [Candidatus Tisiphia endosymbiont of Thecophora atra]|uniref:hypothetical protein n=1 Tax=Candidatus Tisiphia endosymbiont of Thecophora atra TaxID=3066258 RepID=UPI00312C7458
MVKYKMADDFDDGDKGTQLQVRYDKLMAAISAKDMNISPLAVNALKEQIVALSQLAGLAGISLDIGALESALIVREAEVEFQYSKTVKETYGQDNKELTEEEQERVSREKKVGDIYKKFDSFHEKHLGQQIERNENLGKALKAMEKGEDVDEETKKKLNRTPEELEEEKLRWQHIALTNRIAEEQQKHHTDEIKKIEELEEKINHLPKKHPDRILLADKKKYHEHHYDLAKVQEAKCTKQYRERDEEARKLIKCQELAEKHENQGNKELTAKLEEQLRKIHGVHPKEILTKSAQQEAKKIHQILETNNKDVSKKKVDNKQGATEQLGQKPKVVINNNKSKHSPQWEI